MTSKNRILAVLIVMLLIALTAFLAIAGIFFLDSDISVTTQEGLSYGTGPLQLNIQESVTGDVGDSFQDVIQSLINAFKTVVQGFVELILSPVKAIASIFSGWAKTIGSTWYGPLLAVAIFAIIFFMFRTFGVIDSLLDKLNI